MVKNKSNFRIKNVQQHKTYSKFDVEINLPNKKQLI